MLNEELTAEERVLILFSRLDLTDRDVEEMNSLAGELDYDKLTTLAVEHRVAPLIGHHLTSDQRTKDMTHRKFRQTMVISNLMAQVHERKMFQELERLQSLFSDAGIKVVVLKGAGMANLVYRRPGVRASNDIDLILPPADASAAHKMLITEGYIAWLERENRKASEAEVYKVMNSHVHLLPYVRGSFCVELHQFEGIWSTPFRLAPVYEDATQVKLVERNLWFPTLLDQFIFSCVNFRKDVGAMGGIILANLKKGRLRHVVDIRESYLAVKGDLDNQQLLRRATTLNAENAVFDALVFTEKIFGSFPDWNLLLPGAYEETLARIKRVWNVALNPRVLFRSDEMYDELIVKYAKDYEPQIFECKQVKGGSYADNAITHHIGNGSGDDRVLAGILLEPCEEVRNVPVATDFILGWDNELFHVNLDIEEKDIIRTETRFGYKLLFAKEPGEYPLQLNIVPTEENGFFVLKRTNEGDSKLESVFSKVTQEPSNHRLDLSIPWEHIGINPDLGKQFLFDVIVTIYQNKEGNRDFAIRSWATGKFVKAFKHRAEWVTMNRVEFV